MGYNHGLTTDALRYVLPCLDFQKKLINTITTTNFYLKVKENNENDIAAQVFLGCFYSSRLPSQIGPTADFEDAAIPPPIFSMGIIFHAVVFFFGLGKELLLKYIPRSTMINSYELQ